METNILGLPSLTGFTPLKASLEGLVLKYDFKGIGPMVVDKSGHGNLGRLKPKDNPPRRKIVSGFPFEVALVLNEDDERVSIPREGLVPGEGSWSVYVDLKLDTPQVSDYGRIVSHPEEGGLGRWNMHYRTRREIIRYYARSESGEYIDIPVPAEERISVGLVLDREAEKLSAVLNDEIKGEVDFPYGPIKPGSPWSVGADPDGGRPLRGRIFTVKMYNRPVYP